MAHSGAPDITVTAGDFTVAIIAASWHTEVMDGLIAGAERGSPTPARRRRSSACPAAFELAVAAARVAKHFDAVVALGVVIRGGTPHFDYVCSAATDGLNRVALDSGKPVGFGVLTCDNDEQARDRAGLPGSREDKGHEAMTAALATASALKDYPLG
ncbi:6,7-dimethyl-8-ribityllumazine synthase [Brevibacterium casei]|nr:6,7-dimethyl-8-ribityllumazine synthase [Brevibacterium casei]